MSFTVMTIGTFDILHGEHIHLLNECKLLAGDGKVIVGINTDEFIEKYKGCRPTIPYAHRQLVINSLRMVRESFPNDNNSVEQLIMDYRPDYLAVGSDWAYPKDYLGQIGLTFKFLYEQNCSLVFIPSLGEVHSSDFKFAKGGQVKADGVTDDTAPLQNEFNPQKYVESLHRTHWMR